MATRSRGIKASYAEEMNQEGIATQVEMEEAFTEHIANDHTAEGLLPTPEEDNQILKSWVNDDDELAWTVVAADDPEEGLKVIALPYYWDEDREMYLDNNVVRVVNYINSNGCEDEYLYHIPGIRSCVMPWGVFTGEKYCVVGLQFNTENTTTGEVLELRNITGSSSSTLGGTTYEYDTLYTLDVGSDDVSETLKEDLAVLLDEGFKLSSFMLDDADADKPAMVMMLRKVWEAEE